MGTLFLLSIVILGITVDFTISENAREKTSPGKLSYEQVPLPNRSKKLYSLEQVVAQRRADHYAKNRKIYFGKRKYCSVNFKDRRLILPQMHDGVKVPTIYFVTPTFPRPEQIPELTRLSHTLMHVPKLHWVLADDSGKCPNYILEILRRSGLPYTFIASPKPDFWGRRPFPSGVIPRGVPNRRAALRWIRDFAKEGILYFGDDDNAYDLDLFTEIRKTKKLGMLPVGLILDYLVSTPVVSDGKVVGFFDSWIKNRTFPVDMAGFAVNLSHLNASAVMPYEAGMLEDHFLTSAGFEIDDIEPLADNCTRVLVWHTQTVKHAKARIRADCNYIDKSKYKSLGILLRDLHKKNLIKLNPNEGRDGYVTLANHTSILLRDEVKKGVAFSDLDLNEGRDGYVTLANHTSILLRDKVKKGIAFSDLDLNQGRGGYVTLANQTSILLREAIAFSDLSLRQSGQHYGGSGSVAVAVFFVTYEFLRTLSH